MTRYIRKRFLIGLLVLLALSAAGYVTVRAMIDPEAIRQKAVRTLSEYLDADVTIERATFDPVLGLRIEELKVSVTDEKGGRKLLAAVPRVKLAHTYSSVFSGELSYRDIVLEDAEIHLERDADGRSNIERLIRALRRSAAADKPYPTLRLERASFRYTDHKLADPDGTPLAGTFENVTGWVEPLNSRGGKFRANVTGQDPALGMWTIRNATFDTAAETVDFKATSTRIAVNEELRKRVNGRGREIWDLYTPEGGTVKVEAFFTYDGSALRTLDFEVHLHFDGVSATYARFPYRFEEAVGTVICRRDGLELENLVGRAGPMRATFNGRTEGYAVGCPLSLRIEGSGIPLDAKLRAALNRSRQRVWDEMSPAGVVDLVCRLDREKRGEPTRVRVLATHAPGTRVGVRYAAFPYPLELEGWALFDAGAVGIVEKPTSTGTLEDLEPGVMLARHGNTLIQVRGGIGHAEPYRMVDLTFDLPGGKSLPLDETLKHALSKPMQQLWERLALSGTTRGRCRILRTDRKEKRLDVAVELAEFKSHICYDGFPYELHDSEGTVTFEKSVRQWPDGRIVVRDLRGHRDGATVAFDGELAGFREGKLVEQMDLNVRGANLPLDAELRKAVPEKYQKIWDYLSPTPRSRINVTCKIERKPAAGKPDVTLKIDSADSSLMCADFPYRVDGLRGSAEYRRNVRYPDGMLQLKDLRSAEGNCEVKVSGVLIGFAEKRKIDRLSLLVEGRGVPLDEKLRGALSEKHRKTYDTFRPEGTVDVACVLKRTRRDEKLDTQIVITPLGATLTYERFPLRVTDVAGRIMLAGDAVRVSRLKGRLADGTVQLDGLLHRDEREPGLDLNILATDVALKPEIEKGLPEKYRKLWRELKLGGRMTLQGNVKRVRDAQSQKTRVEYSGTVFPKHVSVKLGPGLDDLTGSIWVRGMTTGKGHHFRGGTDLRTLSCKGNRLREVRGAFEKREDQFRIYQLKGKLYGGSVQAQMRIQLGNPIAYGVVAHADSVHLGRLLRELFGTKTDKISGLLSGKLRLQGKGADTRALVGEADLKVSRGKLWEVPFVLALLKVLDLSFPERTAFTNADCKFAFYGKKVHVSELNLVGSAVSIYGKGTVASTGAVNFNFETGLGRLRLPPVPVVSDIVRGVQQQILSVKMTGTLKQPKLEILPIVPITLPMMGLVDSIRVTKEPK